jgi:hypothetical protein
MRINRFAHLVLTLSLAGAGIAQAQPEPTPPSDADAGPGLWIVAGGGGVLARGHCSTCSREGVFFYSPGLLVDAGIQINLRVDTGIEVSMVSSRIDDLEPIRTTFVLGVGQFRPWADRGLSLRAGMGIGFVGNGIYNFAQRNLEPPFTTNAMAVVLGIAWEFLRRDSMTFQILGTHHVAALGELTTTTGNPIQDVVGNYWLVGGALVIR